MLAENARRNGCAAVSAANRMLRNGGIEAAIRHRDARMLILPLQSFAFVGLIEISGIKSSGSGVMMGQTNVPIQNRK
jgi:hypothetical protein